MIEQRSESQQRSSIELFSAKGGYTYALTRVTQQPARAMLCGLPQSLASLEDGRRGGAAHAAGRVERVDAEELVDDAAGDAEHRRAAVLALRVELEGLRLGGRRSAPSRCPRCRRPRRRRSAAWRARRRTTRCRR